ncbi:hypothetical protein [Streptomyces sp. NPDC088789]
MWIRDLGSHFLARLVTRLQDGPLARRRMLHMHGGCKAAHQITFATM